LANAQPSSGTQGRNWPQWRGPTGTGVAPHGNPPVEWSESKNIRWKVELPGRGHASPIVWGDRVYVQTAIKTEKKVEPQEPATQPAEPEGRRGRGGGSRMSSAAPTHIHKFLIIAIDRRTGDFVWQQTLCEVLPHEAGHPAASQASNSPATDGEHIIAYFGSRGLYCLDMQGQVLWEKNFGPMQTIRGFGEGSSPALHGDTVVVNWDHEGQSFIVAFDKRTGEQRWKVDRDERTSWATPLVVTADGHPQVITSATNGIRSYDLKTGELRWQCGGMTRNVIPSPVCGNGLTYCTSGFRGSALLAIRHAQARGDITDSDAIAWVYDGKGTPYIPSPLLYGDKLYFLQENREVLSCVDAERGQPHYSRQRLEGLGGVYASPVGASDRVYVVGREGKTAVIQHGPEYKLLATNVLDDGFTASPAIVANEIFLRGLAHLYCIAAD
jgi:outer membrane protein assembly factor BamB